MIRVTDQVAHRDLGLNLKPGEAVVEQEGILGVEEAQVGDQMTVKLAEDQVLSTGVAVLGRVAQVEGGTTRRGAVIEKEKIKTGAAVVVLPVLAAGAGQEGRVDPDQGPNQDLVVNATQQIRNPETWPGVNLCKVALISSYNRVLQ